MPKTARRKPTPSDPVPDPESELQPEGEGEGEGEMGNGAAQEEGGGEQEPPARMDVKISGTPSAVQAAAKKVSGQSGKRPAPAEEPPEEDENAPLLADPKNMVIVTRQLPRVWELPSGQKVRCAFKVDRYGCPMRREEIEEDVFDRFGGKKYNVTIHPNTTTGENTILGAFTIEHPNPDEPPYIEDPEGDAAAAAEAASRIPGGTDPTLRETDSLANMKASLERRLDRARIMKEVREMEKLAKEAERELDGDGKPSAPSAPAGPDPRDREIAELRARLEKKEIDDRFVALQTQIAETNRLIQTIANRPSPAPEPKSGGDDSLVIKLLNQSQQHAKDMIDLMKNVNRPAPVAASAEGGVTSALEVISKVKGILGKDDSRASQLEEKILDSALDRMLDGGEPGEEEDTMKFAIKQFTPVLRTYVEKQVEKEEGGKGGEKVSKERLKEIYAEAAGKAAKELEEKWRKEGWLVRDPKLGGPAAKPGLPAPQKKQAPQLRNIPGGKVVAREKTSEGIVEHIQVQPADLSEKKKDAPKEEVEVKYTEMPGVGKVEIPGKPGEMKYDRRRSVNYVLDSILSEIKEGTPAKGAEDPKIESYVPADALEYLDDELLEQVWKSSSGDELKGVLGAWGDKAKIDAIEEAGKDKIVDSWVRRVIRTIQDVWHDQKKEKGQ